MRYRPTLTGFAPRELRGAPAFGSEPGPFFSTLPLHYADGRTRVECDEATTPTPTTNGPEQPPGAIPTTKHERGLTMATTTQEQLSDRQALKQSIGILERYVDEHISNAGEHGEAMNRESYAVRYRVNVTAVHKVAFRHRFDLDLWSAEQMLSELRRELAKLPTDEVIDTEAAGEVVLWDCAGSELDEFKALVHADQLGDYNGDVYRVTQQGHNMRTRLWVAEFRQGRGVDEWHAYYPNGRVGLHSGMTVKAAIELAIKNAWLHI